MCKNINIKYLCKKPSSKKCNNQWTVRREPSLRCHLKLNSWVTQAGKMVKPIAKHPHAERPCKRYSTHTMLSVCAKNILQSVHYTKTKAFPLMQISTIACSEYTRFIINIIIIWPMSNDISIKKNIAKTLIKVIINVYCHNHLLLLFCLLFLLYPKKKTLQFKSIFLSPLYSIFSFYCITIINI